MAGLFEAINLDGLSSQKELDEAYRVLDILKCYAWDKSRAMWYREKGRIAGALACEKNCERIYESLPDWARW